MAAAPQNLTKRRSTWEQKLLALDFNLHKSRTCDVFFLVESNEECSAAVEKFKNGARIDPTNALKSIQYEDILKTVEMFSKDASPTTKLEHILHRKVAQQAEGLLKENSAIPRDLLANMIKLQIVYTINQDVVNTQKKIFWEQNLEKECAALVVPTEAPGKKGKDKMGKEKKGKDKKGKDKKGKSGLAEKVYDICDSNNDPKFKPTSTLSKDDKDILVGFETVTVDEKHLFIVLVGFYDFHLIEELQKVGVNITGIVELGNLAQEDQVQIGNFGKTTSQKSLPFDQEAQQEIAQFWHKIYEHLENPDGLPLHLNNVFHMTIRLPYQSFDRSINDDRHCLQLFSDIGSAIIKSPDIQRQHTNYIRSLKMCSVGPEPRDVPPYHFKTYNKIINTFPPDCCNIFVIMHALIEEVSKRVPDPPRFAFDTPPSTTATQSDTSNLNEGNPKMYNGIKGEIRKVLKKNLTSDRHTQRHGEKHQFDPKMNIETSNKPFLVQENNNIEILANSYGKLRVKLLDISFKLLETSNSAVLLWKEYPYVEEEQQNMLEKMYRLQTIADELNLPLQELQYMIHTIIFNSFQCKIATVGTKGCSGSLQSLFPKRVSNIPNVITKHIPFKFDVETFPTSEGSLDTEILHVSYLDEPSLQEAKNLHAYKWYEVLPLTTSLQELHKTDRDFLCMDYRYCSFDDSILLRYHNDLDEFGINTKTWDQSLRTPISSLREFCKYVLHADSKWLGHQEAKHIAACRHDFEHALNENCLMKRNFYPELAFGENDFIQRPSIKGRLREELKKSALVIEPVGKGKKSEAKGKKAEAKGKGKGKDSKAASTKNQGKSEKAGPGTQIAHLEKLSKPVVPLGRRKLSLRAATPEEPFSFYAYDIGNSQVQLTGTTTVFQSQDGVKVTIDQTRFLGKKRRISINISINDHAFILHHNHGTLSEPLLFHLALSDGAVISFVKPLHEPKPEEKLGENICQALKGKKKERRQEIYFISEKQRSVLKCFNVPYISKRNLVLSEDLITPFLKQLSVRGIKTRLELTDVSQDYGEKIEEAVSRSESKKSVTSRSTTSRSTERPAPPRYCYDIISKRGEHEKVSVYEKKENNSDEEHAKVKRSLSRESMISPTPLTRSNKKLLRKMRQMVDSRLPIFKICSSKLHKYQYVKRVKSRVEVPLGTVLKRIPYKVALPKPKVDLAISRLLPVKIRGVKPNPLKYDIRISLPSGLTIQSIEGTEGSPFNIRQRYLDKGPQCKNIAHEYSRTFTRTGNIIIKRCDGNVDVLGAGGQQLKLEIPYLQVKSVFRPKRKQQTLRTGNHLIPLHMSDLRAFQKQLHRSINRLRRHQIDGYKSQHSISYKACQRWKKNYIKDIKQVYILQNSLGNMKKLSLITCDGKKMNVTPSAISEEKICYTKTATDYRYQEVYYASEDGTHGIINHESLLVTQFPDGTRLTTWIDIERELVYLEKREEVTEANVRNVEQQVYEYDLDTAIEAPESIAEGDTLEQLSTMTFQSDTVTEEQTTSTFSLGSTNSTTEEGWLSIHLNVKYEHPNYATIIYYGADNHSEIVLPNNVTLNATSEGEYIANIDPTTCTTITTEEILLESRLCSTCLQKTTNKLNIKPLYHKSQLNPHKTELLRTTDSYKKIFVVNYDGQCLRNVSYQQGMTNTAGCQNHNNPENQKLFVLGRSFTGCKLWDVNSYRQLLTKAKRREADIYQGEARTEIRNRVKIPYHEKFLIPYQEPVLVLTKNAPKVAPLKDVAYVTRHVVHRLPEFSKLRHIYSCLLELVFESANREFQTFLNSVMGDILGKYEKPADANKKETKAPPLLAQKTNHIPFHVRHQKWAKECAKRWKEIRDGNVPNYFNSKYFQIASGITPHGSESNSSIGTICECKGTTGLAVCECGKTNSKKFSGTIGKNDMQETTSVIRNRQSIQQSISGDSSSASSISDGKSETPLVDKREDIEGETALSGRYVSSIQRSNVASHEAVDAHISSKLEVEELRYSTEVGKLILDEIKTKIIEAALAETANPVESGSLDKIETIAKNLVNDLLEAVHKYNSDTISEDYVTIVSIMALEKIVAMHLHPVELILLLDRVDQDKTLAEISRLCRSKRAATLTEKVAPPRILDPAGASPIKIEKEKTPNGENICSYFGVYSYYMNSRTLRGNLSQQSPSLEPEPERSKSQDKTATLQSKGDVLECPRDTKTAIVCTSDHPCYSDTKLWFKKVNEKCDKCITYTEPEPPQRDSSKCSVKYSQSDIVFSYPSLHESETLPISSSSTVNTSDMFSQTSDTITNIEISPESSLLHYCLSENLATIEGSTVALQKYECDDNPSLMVLFSVGSLKDKDLERPIPGPYIQRNPGSIAAGIENVATGKSIFLQQVQFPGHQKIHENLQNQFQEESNKSLIHEKSLHKCQKCILQLEENLDKSESLSQIKTKSVASLLAALKRASCDTLSSANKEKITASITNILETLPVKGRPFNFTTGKLVSEVSDGDRAAAKGLCPVGSITILSPTRTREEATRRSVGSQTRPQVDRVTQT